MLQSHVLSVNLLERAAQNLVNMELAIAQLANFVPQPVCIWRVTARRSRQIEGLIGGLVVVKVSCFFKAVFAVCKPAELAVAHLFRVGKLVGAGLTVVKRFALLVRLSDKKYRVAIFIVEFDVVYEEGARLLKQVLDVVMLFARLGSTLRFFFFFMILLERHLEVAVGAQHGCQVSQARRRFGRERSRANDAFARSDIVGESLELL